MRVIRYLIGGVIGVYFVARAIAEPFIIDLGDPATYANDWGGPSLLGVLAVHCGPGLLVLVITAALIRRQFDRRARRLGGGG